MVNPLCNHLDMTICADADDAIKQGFNWSAAVPPEQRARLISGGPNAGRVRRAGCYECAWGKVARVVTATLAAIWTPFVLLAALLLSARSKPANVLVGGAG